MEVDAHFPGPDGDFSGHVDEVTEDGSGLGVVLAPHVSGE